MAFLMFSESNQIYKICQLFAFRLGENLNKFGEKSKKKGE